MCVCIPVYFIYHFLFHEHVGGGMSFFICMYFFTHTSFSYIYIYIYSRNKCLAFFYILIYLYLPISTASGKTLKLEVWFIYLSNNISSLETNVNIHLAKTLTAIDRLLIIWNSDLSDEIKWDFFQSVAV